MYRVISLLGGKLQERWKKDELWACLHFGRKHKQSISARARMIMLLSEGSAVNQPNSLRRGVHSK